MRAQAFPEAVDLSPGHAGHIALTITNTRPVIDAYRVQVFGLDPEWVTVTPDRLSLFPGQTEQVEIEVALPVDYPASQRTLAVNVTSDDDPGAFALSQVALAVLPRTRTTLRVDPVMVTGGRKAQFGLIVSNDGNAPVDVTPVAVDPEDLAEFTFTPAAVTVVPGREQVIDVTATRGRAWFGQPRPRTFTFGAVPDGNPDARVEQLGTFLQRPRISRWLISLMGLLTAAAVFAAVLSRTFDSVVEEARVSPDVLDQALRRDDAGGVEVPTDPSSVSGRVVSATNGKGLAGAQADLFLVSALDSGDDDPYKTAATESDGVFTFGNLGAGRFKLRISGAGIDTVWYGDSRTANDAEVVVVELATPFDAGEIKILGTPVDVKGVIAVADPAGTTVTLVVPGASGEQAVVATAQLAPDGSFTLPGVPSPGDYQLIVQQPGSPPQTRDLSLEPGRPLPDIKVAVQSGTGLISGTVTGPFGLLGGATVTASDGTSEITTVSLTEGAVGTYELRNLATPGQYTVTIERPGFAPEARTIALSNEQSVAVFDAGLMPANGSIRGRALVDGAVSRGLSVTVNGGNVSRTTGVISQGGNAGAYAFTGLPAPGTYTLTFNGPGVVPQVRVIDIDPLLGAQDVTGVDVSLARQQTVVEGTVRGPDGTPLGQATVTLTDGANPRTVLSADDPVGRFSFSDVSPGAYTLSASRLGAEPVVQLVTVTSGTSQTIDLSLGAQASLHGAIADPRGRTLTVRLFLPAQFPQGTALATTTADANGRYEFLGLEAPANYMVAVYDGPTSGEPLDSIAAPTVPGQATEVATITLPAGV